MMLLFVKEQCDLVPVNIRNVERQLRENCAFVDMHTEPTLSSAKVQRLVVSWLCKCRSFKGCVLRQSKINSIIAALLLCASVKARSHNWIGTNPSFRKIFEPQSIRTQTKASNALFHVAHRVLRFEFAEETASDGFFYRQSFF